MTRRGAYIGWTGHQNLGDEAMFDVCRELFPEIAWTPVWRLVGRRSSLAELRTRVIHKFARRRGDEVGILGGGTLLGHGSPWIDQYLALRRQTGRPVPVFSPGVEDPAFASSRTAWSADLAAWRDATRELPVVGVRGPRSLRLLRDAGFENVRMTGDPVLAMHAAGVPPPGRRIVAINAGRSPGRMWGDDQDNVLANLADAARRLHSAGWTVRLVPTWDQDVEQCRDVARRAGLSDAAVEPLLLDAREWIGLIQRFDVVVTLKLHAAVLAAVAGTPFVPLEYRPKVRDFCESIDWVGPLMRTDDFTGERLECAVNRLYDDLSTARAVLTDRVGSLAAEFRRYAAELREMLLS